MLYFTPISLFRMAAQTNLHTLRPLSLSEGRMRLLKIENWEIQELGMSDSTSTRHGRFLAESKVPPIPDDWDSPPGRFRSAWDLQEHMKIHEAEKSPDTLRDLPLADLRNKFFP